MKEPFLLDRSKKLFWICLLTSLASHCFIAITIYIKPVWIGSLFSLFSHTNTVKDTVYEEKNDFLKEAFDHLTITNAHTKKSLYTPLPRKESPSPLIQAADDSPKKTFIPYTYSEQISPLEKPREALSSKEPLPARPSMNNTVLLLALDDSILQTIPLPPVAIESTEIQDTLSTSPSAPLEELSPGIPTTTCLEKNGPYFSFEHRQQPIEKSLASLPFIKKNAYNSSSITFKDDEAWNIRNYKLPEFDRLHDLSVLFDIDVQMMQRKEPQGIFFAINLIPKKEALSQKLKQHFHFIIDCSQGQKKYQTTIYKQALTKALEYLSPEDTFNIYLVSDTTKALFAHPTNPTSTTLSLAKEFLDSRKPKAISSQASLTDLLHKIATFTQKHASIAEIDSVILMTDGSLLEKAKKMKSFSFKSWLRDSSFPFLLYTATIGNEPHPAILDAVTMASGGHVLHSTTHAAFPRKFAKLILDLKSPIATHINPKLFVADPSLHVSLMKMHCQHPPLFADRKTTFFGSADKASLFTLYVSGAIGDSTVHLSFDIDLAKSSQGKIAAKEVALHNRVEKALSLYLTSGEVSHLEKAIEELQNSSISKKTR